MTPLEKITQLYNEFMSKMNKGLTSARDAVECEAKIVEVYPEIAMDYRDAKKAHRANMNALLQSLDPATNKPYAYNKAEKVADGSEQGLAYQDAKAVTEIYENFKYALKDYAEILNKEWSEMQP